MKDLETISTITQFAVAYVLTDDILTVHYYTAAPSIPPQPASDAELAKQMLLQHGIKLNGLFHTVHEAWIESREVHTMVTPWKLVG